MGAFPIGTGEEYGLQQQEMQTNGTGLPEGHQGRRILFRTGEETMQAQQVGEYSWLYLLPIPIFYIPFTKMDYRRTMTSTPVLR